MIKYYYATGTLTFLIQPSLINTVKSKLIYSDILVTGRLVSWASGPQYSDVDISDTSSQDSSNLLFFGGCKVLKFCSVLDIKIPSTATFCHNALPSIFNPVVEYPPQQRTRTVFGLRALGGHRRMGLRSLVHSLGLHLD